MHNHQLVRTSYRALVRHPGRSVLTMLGIIIGIASIIAILAIGKGAELQIQAQIAAMGSNYIGVSAINSAKRSKLRVLQQKSRSKLKTIDAQILKRHVPEINAISPYIAEKGTVSYRETTVEVVIKGGNEDFLTVLNRRLLDGSLLHSHHVVRNSRVVILGFDAAQKLACRVGSIVSVNGIPFSVLGILAKIPSYLGNEDPNYNIIIPITTLKKQIQQSSGTTVHALVLNTKDIEDIRKVRKHIRRILRARHRLQASEPDDFTIATQQALADTAQKTSSTFTLFLFLIASIALLVGGIGIMNIMLVAVSERQREIGIRMSLGAAPWNIRRQFIIEAVLLCLTGGSIGILLGILIAYGTAYFVGWHVVVTLISILSAFGITTLIGIFFGAYPAHKAAYLNPVDALAER